jgi:hypothetical protein
MRIACLAWGSLVWNPGDLQIGSSWFDDGPLIPVEFARQSGGHRITLVIGRDFQPVTSLWAWMRTASLSLAIEDLRAREGTVAKRIGVWEIGLHSPELIPDLSNWAENKGADAVIWTALPPKFQDVDNRVPTIEEVITYLHSLDLEKKKIAEEYIRNAPKQIETRYRKQMEMHFGWYPV